MSPLTLAAIYISQGVRWTWVGFQVAAGLMGMFAFLHCLTRHPQYFLAAGKRTKGFWLGVNAAGLAVVALMGAASMLGLLGFVANAVYLADVRPALALYQPVVVRARVRRHDDGRGGSAPDRGR